MLDAPRIDAVVLAAGRSSRMGGPNKLLCEVGAATMIERAVRAALDSQCAQVVVVTGWQAESVEAAFARVPRTKPLRVVRNPNYADGLSTSLRCGLAALPETVDAALVQLADMPWIGAGHIDRVIAAFDRGAPSIVAAVRDRRQGHPVLWPRRYFAAIAELAGDRGARELLAWHSAEVRGVQFVCDDIFEDVDTPEQLAREQARG